MRIVITGHPNPVLTRCHCLCIVLATGCNTAGVLYFATSYLTNESEQMRDKEFTRRLFGPFTRCAKVRERWLQRKHGIPSMKAPAAMTLLTSMTTSALVWAFSPVLTGHREPWDADRYYYPVALLISGASAGVLSHRPLWAHYVGAVIGQLAYELIFLPVGPLILVGAIFLVVYSTVHLVAAAFAGYFRTRLSQASIQR
jgi:hypothetical protein